MLSKVFRSEFILNRKVILIDWALIAGAVVLLAMVDDKGILSLTPIGISIGFYTATILVRQSKFNADGTVCALPIGRRQLVLGKYLFSFLFSLASLALAALAIGMVPNGTSSGVMLNSDSLIRAFVATMLVSALISPLVLFYGAMGIMVLILGLNILGLFFFVLGYVRLLPVSVLDFVFEGIPALLTSWRVTLGTPLFSAASLIALLAVYFVSLKVSQWLYDMKEF